ncbi:MAG: hypothetical protein ABI251_07005 [Mycobacteriaceae bacterium]
MSRERRGLALLAVVLLVLTVVHSPDGAVVTGFLIVLYFSPSVYQDYRSYQRPVRVRAVLQRLGVDGPER